MKLWWVFCFLILWVISVNAQICGEIDGDGWYRGEISTSDFIEDIEGYLNCVDSCGNICLPIEQKPTGTILVDNLMYASMGRVSNLETFAVFDVSDAANPRKIWFDNEGLGGLGTKIYYSPERKLIALVSAGSLEVSDTLSFWSVEEFCNPILKSSIVVPGELGHYDLSGDFIHNGDYFILSSYEEPSVNTLDGRGIIQTIDIQNIVNPEFLGNSIPVVDSDGNGDVAFALIKNGNFFYGTGKHSMKIIDATNPLELEVTTTYDIPEFEFYSSSLTYLSFRALLDYDKIIRDGYLYMVRNTRGPDGVFIFSVDGASLELVAARGTGTNGEFDPLSTAGGETSALVISEDGNYLVSYLGAGSALPQPYFDISNPNNPIYKGNLENPGSNQQFSHPESLTVIGDYLYSTNPQPSNRINVYDVSDWESPVWSHDVKECLP